MAMTGEYQHSLDAKGRISIPARLRDELGAVFYVTVSEEKCLNAYSEAHWEEFSAKVSAMPLSKKKMVRALFAFAAKCELDSQGRALLPQQLRSYANLTKSVTIVGNNDHVQFWDSEQWAAVAAESLTPESILAAMEAMQECGF